MKKATILISVLLIIMISSEISAQIILRKSFGSYFKEYANDSKPTHDGGIIILGDMIDPNDQLNADIILVKIDSNNNIQWKKRYSLGNFDKSSKLEITSDNGYLLACYTTAIDSAGFLIIKTDSIGNIIWSKTYGGQIPYDLEKTKDKGYIITGSSADIIYP
jgi:hypothetical protein